jgi:uncharacterized caspase-like protein
MQRFNSDQRDFVVTGVMKIDEVRAQEIVQKQEESRKRDAAKREEEVRKQEEARKRQEAQLRADAEKKRQADEDTRLRAEAPNMLQDIQEFIKAGSPSINLAEAGVLFGRARPIQRGDWNSELRDNYVRIKEFISKSGEFASYRVRQEELRRQELVTKVADLRERLNAAIPILEVYLKENFGSQQTERAAVLLKLAKETSETKDLPTLTSAWGQVETFAREQNLEKAASDLLVKQPLSSASESSELAFWDSIKASKDPNDYKAYLETYPTGRFVALARARSQLKSEPPQIAAVPTKPVAPPELAIDYGRYHALVIGNNVYRSLPKLESAVADARAVGSLLRAKYGYEVKVLENATRAVILDALAQYRVTLKGTDNLLIYYAGHGYLDKGAEQGYWLPIDADRDSPANWIANNDLTVAVRTIGAKHVMLVADSCFSGTLLRAPGMPVSRGSPERLEWLKRMATKKARVVLSSGGVEPVLDGGGSGHSVFAKVFLDTLSDNESVLDGQTLFDRIKRPVALNSPQTPEYSDIRQAGHDGGDFLFVRRK